MRRVFIRPKEIKSLWEVDNACVVEQYDGKKWVCTKTMKAEDGYDWSTMLYIKQHQNYDFIELFLKGKSDSYGNK